MAHRTAGRLAAAAAVAIRFGLMASGATPPEERALRIHDPTPPIQDAAGEAGGRPVIGTEGTSIGPGHIGLFQFDRTDLASMHFYDGDRQGRPTLAIRRVQWTSDGSPEIVPE